ncbi:multidrug effflux MFS transporter [Brevibacillus ruminantium]|uniref:Bcr/CflA family efflux transporter n=1 Tax=Brevibacillus ruminantium TaxID=2950604 RepID=A0ABY4W833_9BACL|nr:multidrug effflux MFS transporter [Brevibacillus ruminantium]USG63336.1 multidrug effflux MFS transporter [Brevibacillus ruminantium]
MLTYKSMPQEKLKSRRVMMVLILGSLTAFGPLSLDMYLPSLPMIADELKSTTSLVQLSLTSCLLGLSIGQLLAGPLSDIQGRRKPLLIGLAVYILTSLLCAVMPSIWGFVALRFIQGLAGAAGIVIARAMVRDQYEGVELTKFTSLLMLVNGSAPILAPIFGGQLLAYTSWRGVFLVLSLIGVCMLFAVLLKLPETLPVERRSKGGIKQTFLTFRGLFQDRIFMGYALSQGLVTAAMFAYISGSPFVIQNIYGASPQMFSLLFAINGLGIIIAGQITGRLAGKVRETVLLKVGLGIAACGGVALLAMILMGTGLAAVLPPLFLVVSSVGIVSTTAFSLAMQNQAKAAGSASALIGLLSFVTGGLVAPLVGLGGSSTAVPMGIVIALADIGAVLCFYFMVHRKK